jgi:hypothetical protein
LAFQDPETFVLSLLNSNESAAPPVLAAVVDLSLGDMLSDSPIEGRAAGMLNTIIDAATYTKHDGYAKAKRDFSLLLRNIERAVVPTTSEDERPFVPEDAIAVLRCYYRRVAEHGGPLISHQTLESFLGARYGVSEDQAIRTLLTGLERPTYRHGRNGDLPCSYERSEAILAYLKQIERTVDHTTHIPAVPSPIAVGPQLTPVSYSDFERELRLLGRSMPVEILQNTDPPIPILEHRFRRSRVQVTIAGETITEEAIGREKNFVLDEIATRLRSQLERHAIAPALAAAQSRIADLSNAENRVTQRHLNKEVKTRVHQLNELGLNVSIEVARGYRAADRATCVGEYVITVNDTLLQTRVEGATPIGSKKLAALETLRKLNLFVVKQAMEQHRALELSGMRQQSAQRDNPVEQLQCDLSALASFYEVDKKQETYKEDTSGFSEETRFTCTWAPTVNGIPVPGIGCGRNQKLAKREADPPPIL